MNILICGSSGYLGCALSNELSQKYNVFSCVRNLKKKKYLKNSNVIKVDYLNYKSLEKKFKNIDIVFHLVGLNKKNSVTYPRKSIDVKKKITSNIVEACNKHKVKKLIYFSSIQIYKDFEKRKKISENSKIKPENAYEFAHLEAETIIKNNIINNYLILRISSVFGINIIQGYGEQVETIVNNICFKLIKSKKIIINNGKLIRNFLPLRVLFKFIKSIILFNNKTLNRSIINVGYKSFTLTELADIIGKRFDFLFNSKIKKKIKNKQNRNVSKMKYMSNYFKLRYSKIIMLNEIDNILTMFMNKYENK